MSRPTALGCYIFAGGFTVGVKQAGFKVIGDLESGMFGVRTTERNHPELILGETIHIDPDRWPLAAYEDVDFVYGNPPCAPFSVANASPIRDGATQWQRDPRVDCIRNEFKLLGALRPKVWAWESVQMAWIRGRPLIDDLTRKAAKLGYSATYLLINTVHLGVPQVRRRFFCIFHNIIIPWDYPNANQRRLMTVREAWEELHDDAPEIYGDIDAKLDLSMRTTPGAGLAKQWMKENPDQRRWKRNNVGGVIGRPGFHVRKLSYDDPAPTMIGGASYYHPEERRHLSVKEQQVLCGYPPEYEFVTNTVGKKYTEIGQAVMPPVGKWLGENVRRGIEMNISVIRPTVTLLDFETGKRKL